MNIIQLKNAVILLCLSVILLSGCAVTSQPLSLRGEETITADGLVGEEYFLSLKKENQIGELNSNTGEIFYKWIIFGNALPVTHSQNLDVEVTRSDAECFSFSACADFPAGTAMLLLRLPEQWEAVKAILSAPADGGTKEIPILTSKGPAVCVSYEGSGEYSLFPAPSEEREASTERVCTFSIECSAIFLHLSELNPDKLEALPNDGVVLRTISVPFKEGETAFDVLQRICKDNGIHLESTWTPLYGSAYIEGMNNLYEFDCGAGSGWMYSVNGVYPNFGCSSWPLAPGDVVEWHYTCDLGTDIGGDYAA